MMKTEGLPSMCSPSFSPERVMSYAGKALDFLNRNCATDAATYWLFREPHSQTLQLYDVSQLLTAAQEGVAADHGARTAAAAEASEAAEGAAAYTAQRVSQLVSEVREHALAMVPSEETAASAAALSEEEETATPPEPQPLSRMGKLCYSLAQLISTDSATMRSDRLQLMRRAAELSCPASDPLTHARAHEQVSAAPRVNPKSAGKRTCGKMVPGNPPCSTGENSRPSFIQQPASATYV